MPKKKIKIVIYLDRNVYITNIVQWLTECNIPMDFFSHQCVQAILHPLEDGLKLGHTNRHNILRYLEIIHNKLAEFISTRLRGKLFCIKADTASRKKRNVLGINAQYIHQGEVVVHNLAMLETIERNTAEKIMEEILSVLGRFSVDIKQIYAVTTDNGSNFLKATRLLRLNQIQQASYDDTADLNDLSMFDNEDSDVEDAVDDLDHIVNDGPIV